MTNAMQLICLSSSRRNALPIHPKTIAEFRLSGTLYGLAVLSFEHTPSRGEYFWDYGRIVDEAVLSYWVGNNHYRSLHKLEEIPSELAEYIQWPTDTPVHISAVGLKKGMPS